MTTKQSHRGLLLLQNFGVPFGSKVLSIEIIIDDDHAAPNQYRDGLTYPEDRSQMYADDFSAIVRDLMPVWFKEIIRENPSKSGRKSSTTYVLSFKLYSMNSKSQPQRFVM